MDKIQHSCLELLLISYLHDYDDETNVSKEPIISPPPLLMLYISARVQELHTTTNTLKYSFRLCIRFEKKIPYMHTTY